MIVEWPLLFAAVGILVAPVTWIYSAAARNRLGTYRDPHFRLERMLATWQHWFDLARAAGGTYLLLNKALLVEAESESGLYLKLGVVGGILALALVAQTVHYRRFFYFTAPVFFVWGISVALVDWIPVVFAIVFSALLARLLNHVDVKLPLFAGLLGVAGYLYGGFSFTLLLACVLPLIPLLLAYASMNTIVCYSRDLAVE